MVEVDINFPAEDLKNNKITRYLPYFLLKNLEKNNKLLLTFENRKIQLTVMQNFKKLLINNSKVFLERPNWFLETTQDLLNQGVLKEIGKTWQDEPIYGHRSKGFNPKLLNQK